MKAILLSVALYREETQLNAKKKTGSDRVLSLKKKTDKIAVKMGVNGGCVNSLF